MTEMSGNHPPMNGLDTRIDSRGFFERILKEFKETLAERDKGLDELLEERNKRLDERFVAQKDAIVKAENRLDVMLAGFPQEYAKRLELDQMKATAETTAKVLEQKVVDSASALAEAQNKTEDRADVRMKKMEDYQARLTGVAFVAPILTAIITTLVVLQFN